MKKKSVIVSALEHLGLVKGSVEYSRAYGALNSRAIALRKNGRPVTIANLTATPLKQRGAKRSPLMISSLTELFEQEAEMALKLENIRKEITDALRKGIGEARRRKISVQSLVTLYGGALANADEGIDGRGQESERRERGV